MFCGGCEYRKDAGLRTGRGLRKGRSLRTGVRKKSAHCAETPTPAARLGDMSSTFCAIKHAVPQGLVSRAPLLYFGPASVGARKQLADI